MSATLMEHASSMSDIARENSRQHVGLTAAPRIKEEPPVCPTDDEAVTPKRKAQSLDYIWRSGVAGGIAGCAVSNGQCEPLSYIF
jgi:solute carrier family 25 (mitochondrial carrier protein), member 16